MESSKGWAQFVAEKETYMGLIIRHYIMNMLPYMLIALPILIVVRVWIYAVRKRQGLKLNMFHELGVVIFVLFLIGLVSQTLTPTWGLMAGGLRFVGRTSTRY